MKTGKLLLIATLSVVLCACAVPQIAVNQHADFSAIKRVAVMPFNGPSGEMACELMTQSLLSHGADVVERQQLGAAMREQSLSSSSGFDPSAAKKIGRLLGVDALFLGTVAESRPPSTYLVDTSDKALISNVTQVSSNVYSGGTVPGLPNSQLLSVTANVSLISRMVDVETGSILWSASMTYEGFDTASAMASITDTFVRSLSPIWPALALRK